MSVRVSSMWPCPLRHLRGSTVLALCIQSFSFVLCCCVDIWKFSLRAASPALSTLAYDVEVSLVGDWHGGPCHHFSAPVLVPPLLAVIRISKKPHLVLVALRVLTVECDLLALLSGTQVWFVRVCQPPRDSKVRRFCGHRAAGVSSANENHLASCMGQMGARWEQSGGRAGGRAGQPGAVASGLFPLPIASASFHPCLLECQVVQDWAATSPEDVN